MKVAEQGKTLGREENGCESDGGKTVYLPASHSLKSPNVPCWILFRDTRGTKGDLDPGLGIGGHFFNGFEGDNELTVYPEPAHWIKP